VGTFEQHINDGKAKGKETQQEREQLEKAETRWQSQQQRPASGRHHGGSASEWPQGGEEEAQQRQRIVVRR
jgi:hypothetical protein